ncbi:unnamed protein product [Orchesella dallaii]|uniref:Peptidase M14 domain-containing protein n=1 Tax=Orchesella dallaii TaxID=48710 RepID=A0ABP1PYH7_9HEXA
MDFMLSNHPIAVAIRDHVIVKIVPMINPDGVYLGNFRCSIMGYDLNRQWNQISPWAHPTLSALRNYLIELDSSKTVELDMVIDLHAHTSLMSAFIHGNAYDDVYRFERHILFPKLLAHNADDYSVSHTMYNRDPVKAGTARRHLCEILRSTVNVYTLEVSFFGYHQPATNAVVSYNEDGYFRLGRNVVRTFFEYFRVTGVLQVSAAAAAPSGMNQNQEAEKKRVVRRKSRSRSRSRPKSKGDGAKASSPTQKTAISNGSNGDAWNSPRASVSKDGTPERTVVKLNQLTAENDDSSSSDLSSSDEDDAAKSVKFNGARESVKRQQQHTKRATRGRLSMRRMVTKPPISAARDSSPSPPVSPKPSRSKLIPPQSSVTKPAFRTFDFSILHENYYSFPGTSNQRKSYDSFKRQRERIRAPRATTGRKVGGGGVVGVLAKSSNREYQTISRSNQGNHSDTDTESPCLTIIDFNLLLRKGLDGKTSLNERGWKGWSSGKVMMGNTKSTESGLSRKQGRKEVRRRRAILLRGTITDCSPWEDSSSDSDSSLCPVSRGIGSYFMRRRKQTRSKSSKASFPSSFSS